MRSLVEHMSAATLENKPHDSVITQNLRHGTSRRLPTSRAEVAHVNSAPDVQDIQSERQLLGVIFYEPVESIHHVKTFRWLVGLERVELSTEAL